MPTTDSAPVESSGLRRNGQALDFRATYAETGDARSAVVRYTVHLDTSYPRMQSRAYAEVWAPEALTWHPVASLLSAEWTDTDYARPGGKADEEESVTDALDTLRGLVIPLLAL